MKALGRAPATIILTVLVLSSCGDAPTAPRDVGVHVVYIEGETVVARGEATRLSAFLMRTGEDIADITGQVRWGTGNASVAMVERGLLRAGLQGSTTISAAFQRVSGDAPVVVVSPAPIAVDVRGQYAGTVTFITCDRLAGGGPSPCRDIPGRTFPFELTLANQSSARVSGTMLMIDRTVGPVAGYLDVSGEVVLSGTLGISGAPLASMVRHLRLRLDGARLTGTGESDVAMINAFGPQLTKETYRVDASLR
jgi:hypothetical protein